MIVVLGYALLATLYSIVTPAWEAPDETEHFSYVAYLVQHQQLPVQHLGQLGEAHQPPLYYLLAAGASAFADWHDVAGAYQPNPQFIWAGRGGREINVALHYSDESPPYRGQALALHLARLVSVLMGAATVALTIGIGRLIFPKRAGIALLAGTLVALNPQFLFISGSVNNDNLLTLAATGAWWQTLRAWKEPTAWRAWFYSSVWVAAAMLAKSSGFMIACCAWGALAACAWRRRSWKLLLQGTLALTVIPLLATGWWFLRNQRLYGDPLGWAIFRQIYAAVQRSGPVGWNDIRVFFTTQLNSFAGQFGWMDLWAPTWFYRLIRVIWWLGLGGLALFLVLRGRHLTGYQRAALAFLALAVAAQEAFMLWSITHFNASWYQGRYLFPIIGPLMVLLATGLVGLLPRAGEWFVLPGSTVLLVIVAVFMPLRVISPAYSWVTLPSWDTWFLPGKVDASFGHTFRLAGYRMQETADHRAITVTLYWQALRTPDFNYSAFVHLIDGKGQLVAQNDHAPGEAQGYPPVVWRPGDILADPHTLALLPQHPSGTYRFRVGLYDWQTGVRLQLDPRGTATGDFVMLDLLPQRGAD
jgi:4-amino-4-deoxy-L-arabinose transferase-like glycosyltransferase